MNNTLISRMRGLWVALVVVWIVGAIGTTAASAAAPSAQISGLTAKQKKAKKRALKKCKKVRKASKRHACVKKVKRKYKRLAKRHRPAPKGKTYLVDVKDNFYDPALLNLKVNDTIKWDWKFSTSREGHDVGLWPPFPKGVSSFDFASPIMSGPVGTFKRKFTKPGNYSFHCTLHQGMMMDVRVAK